MGGLEIIDETDLLIVGASVAGVALAEAYARTGARVLLTERRTFPGYEVGAWNRPFLTWEEKNSTLLHHWLPLKRRDIQDGETVAFIPDEWKRHLEERLLAAGVKLLYAVQPVAMCRCDGKFRVTIGGKPGLFQLAATKVIDCTGNGLMGKISSCQPERVFRNGHGRGMVSTVEVTGGPADTWTVAVSPEQGCKEDSVKLHPSGFAAENRILEFDFNDRSEWVALSGPARQEQVRMAVLEVCRELFAGAEWAQVRFGVQSAEYMPVAHFSLGEALSLGLSLEKVLREGAFYLSIIHSGQEENLAANLNQVSQMPEDLAELLCQRDITLSCGNVKGAVSPKTVAGWSVKVRECDIFVGGAGTCGAVCAYTAAAENTVIVADMNDVPGGTGTVGGVHYYWYGHRQGFTREIDDEYERLAATLNQREDFYVWGRRDSWIPDLKASLLWHRLYRRKVSFYPGSLVCGVFRRGDTVVGVLLATPEGLRAVLAAVTVDATGDADLAVHGGMATVAGSEKDGMVMWACMAQYKQAGKYRGGIFTTAADVADIEDYTRFILSNRRRGTEGCYDHGTYVAPRETRHLVGEYVVDVRDVLSLRKYPDTVLTCFSNFDTKGKSWADIVYFGLLPSQSEIHLPYRAVLPVGINGLLVGGKAVSCTHDAASGIRMQDDMQNLGGMLGIAAALAVRYGGTRRFDIGLLQKHLLSVGAIKETAIGNRETPLPDYAKLIEALTGTERWESIEMDMGEVCREISPLAVICLAARKVILPLLTKAFATATGERQKLMARLLLWHGDDSGIDMVMGQIGAALEQEDLPVRKGSVKFCQPYPDHGVMAECSYLVCLLARSTDRRVPDLLHRLARRIAGVKRDYLDRNTCIFGHIESVTYVAVRRPETAMLPALRLLLRIDEEWGKVHLPPYDIMADLDIRRERVAYLRVLIAEGMARCGDREGYQVLADFLDDCRQILANCAARILGELLVLDHKEIDRLKETVGKLPKTLTVRPYQKEIW